MSDTANLSLPLLAASQAQKHITHNEALSLLDGLVMAGVKSRVVSVPPATPLEGHRYLVPTGATGVWASQIGKLALFVSGAWNYLSPKEGWVIWVDDEDTRIAFNGTTWVAAGPSVLQNMSLLGVNTTADATNKLAVASAATLFNHAGNGHQIKINKNAAGDTASVLYQTGFSGRAEFGTTGDDDFHVKVSSNGSTFNEALVIAATSGLVTVKQTLRIDPQANDPASLVDGQVWYNSTTGKFRARQAGASVDVIGSGGGGGLSNAYTSMTDGTVTASAVGGDAFKLRTSNGLSVVVANNDATHGDNALIGLNVPGLSALASPAAADELIVYDASTTSHTRMSLQNMFKVVGSFAEDTALHLNNDAFITWDAAAGEARRLVPTTMFFSERIVRLRNGFEFFTDFFQETSSTAVDNGLAEYISGAGAAVTAVATTAPNIVGVAQSSTGTTATGRAGLGSSLSALRLGGGDWYFDTYIQIPTLSTSAERFQVAIGLFDTQTAINQVDGVYLLYDEGGVAAGSTASANWQCVTSSNSTRTFTTSSTAVGTGFARITIYVNAAGTSVDFLLNGNLMATHTTNLPTGAGREMGFGTLLIKSLGTTARTMNHDYLMLISRYTATK
jgi:hypothetical protein